MFSIHKKTASNRYAFLNEKKIKLQVYLNLYENLKKKQSSFVKEQKIRGLLHTRLDFKIFYEVAI